MELMKSLKRAIDDEAEKIPAQELTKAAAELGRDYQQAAPDSLKRFASAAARAAYLLTRLPAISQVNQLVCTEFARLFPGIDILTVLDLGCGPGTATLAAQLVLGPLQSAVMVDRDTHWGRTANHLLAVLDKRLAAASHFVTADLQAWGVVGEHDLVMISYALGEMAPPSAKSLVERAWNSARRAVVIVEPGTPRGFSATLAARDALIAAQANIVAPCTHRGRCPLAGAADWCHFDTRVERSRRQQHAKAGTLPYEIEKFSYVIAAKAAPALPSRAARIIRHPLKKSGHVILDLCTCEATTQRVVISRRDQAFYRQARQAKWGGIWTPKNESPG